MSHETILILDLGSQYTQLIARRIREAGVFSRIARFDLTLEQVEEIAPKGIVLSGGPASVYAEHAPKIAAPGGANAEMEHRRATVHMLRFHQELAISSLSFREG